MEHNISFTGRIFSRYLLNPDKHYQIIVVINDNKLPVPSRCGFFSRPVVAPDVEVFTERSDTHFDVNIASVDEATLCVQLIEQVRK